MNRCPITFEICESGSYSQAGLKLLSPRLTRLDNFPFSKTEQLEEAARRATKMSIQGVQPKLSVKLNVPKAVFEIVDSGGTYIIKPPHAIFDEVVENEDLTMRLARSSGIDVPLSGMIYTKDGTLSYFIRRFDRTPRHTRLPAEDFAQLSGHSRETKYDSSMEKVASVIEKFCTFPAVEKARLFRLTIFNFLVGNEDMHLKNFSLITRRGKTELSPAYDLLNTTLVLRATEELALPLMGKKSGLRRKHFIDYFGIERLGLPSKLVLTELDRFKALKNTWEKLISECFLAEKTKLRYVALVNERAQTLEL